MACKGVVGLIFEIVVLIGILLGICFNAVRHYLVGGSRVSIVSHQQNNNVLSHMLLLEYIIM